MKLWTKMGELWQRGGLKYYPKEVSIMHSFTLNVVTQKEGSENDLLSENKRVNGICDSEMKTINKLPGNGFPYHATEKPSNGCFFPRFEIELVKFEGFFVILTIR